MHKKTVIAIAFVMLSVLYAQTRLDSGIMYVTSASDQFFERGLSADVLCSTIIRQNCALIGGISADYLPVKDTAFDYVNYVSPFIGLGYEKDISGIAQFRVSFKAGFAIRGDQIPYFSALRVGTDVSTAIHFKNSFEIEPVIGCTVYSQDINRAIPFYEIKAGLRFGYTFANLHIYLFSGF